MPEVAGLVGYLPRSERLASLVAPPYDVIKAGSALEALLRSRPCNLWHVTLGPSPQAALAEALAVAFQPLAEPSLLLCEQRWRERGRPERRLGVLAAIGVRDYRAGEVIRHEKTFDDKVRGRMALTRATGLTLEPVFLLTRAPLSAALERVAAARAPDLVCTPDFGGFNDLHGVEHRLWILPAASAAGQEIARLIAALPLYIADGHHRYHAALRLGQRHCLAYVTERARIQAYNRVIRGRRPFAEVRGALPLSPARWETPPKGRIRIWHAGQAWEYGFCEIPRDPVGRLDCACLERELYPLLGLSHDLILDHRYFDYYPERDLERMRAVVERGDYDIAVALHPVSIAELMAVADAGLRDPRIVMPEKSTYFAPKILSGLVLYRHAWR